MPYPDELKYWTEEVSSAFRGLNRAQAEVLALYSYGMAITQRCGQTLIGAFLGLLLGMRIENLRQRLREWTYEAEQKRKRQRREIEVESLFAPWLKWVVSYWKHPKQLVLAMDVTYLRDRHTILTISVVYRGCAIPVAWRILPGEQKGEWHPIWVHLLNCLSQMATFPPQVWVLTDQGLYSKRLFHVIQGHGWHPCMRVRTQGLYRPLRANKWRSLEGAAYRAMPSKAMRVACFKGDPLLCTLWIHWQAAYDKPCLLVTDLPPKRLRGNPYALRTWVECGFKDLKRGGFRWEQSKITQPERLERLLFIIALALFSQVRQGSALQDELLADHDCPPLSCSTLGWLATLVAAIRQCPLPFAFFSPYSFPFPLQE
jgi:hypothetical protein